MVLHVAHPAPQLDIGVFSVLPEAPPKLGENVTQRLDRPVEVDDFAGELVDPLRYAGVAVEDLLFDLVDVGLQPL